MPQIDNMMRLHRFSGTEEDKSIAAEWLTARFKTSVDPKRVILTNGAQNAMVLALACLAGQGDTVLMEPLSYHGFRKQAHLQGIRTEFIAMDDDGADPEAFETACRAFKPKALFLMPTVHNPTTIVMSRQRRDEIARIARKYGVSIFEDDVYGLLPQDAPVPFGALAPDITWHITSFAKCVGAGVRVGYLVTPDDKAARKTWDRFYGMSSWYPASLSVELLNLWLANGSIAKMVTGVREEAIARQKIAVNCLGDIPFQTRDDALFLWVNLGGIIDQDELVAQCASRNVIIRPGRLFATDPKYSPNCVRLVIGSPDSRDDLQAAMTVIGDLLQSARGARATSGAMAR
ncbi:PLP-dependent aminotransferase family protein [Mesorhizobium sp. IRAMC:0171]|uniref:PLP-dependent aminotransferase family protein n=1 Tax=Mesorhizobium retamae TaxID=2912854 RepID=A0ABS9QD51_9HYPH|nr:PLP-dependent aminotransferase family protein [Mesorhizobium sp. IRAMC:0171]MCG7505346.1 PLP-dependent aminotransferase family protein [Mesorhizobium sp. IRAMC:0171]